MQLRRRHRMAALVLSLGCGLMTVYGLRAAYSQNGPAYADPSTEKAEFYWSRLRYTSSGVGRGGGDGRFGFGFGYGGWAGWSRDYPKADRQFLLALKRLTRSGMKNASMIPRMAGMPVQNSTRYSTPSPFRRK